MTTLEASPAAAEYPLARRVIDTFVSPGRVFEHFRTHTPWAGALAVSVVAGIAVVLAIPQELYVDQAREAIRQAGDAAAQMPAPETMAGFAKIGGAIGVLLVTPIMAFAAAGIFALLFGVIAGGGVRYVQYLAVTTHAMLITSLGGLIGLPVQILSGDLGTRLSLALLVPGLEAGTFAHTLLHAFDVFAIWSLVVAALGVSVLTRRIGWGAASAVLLGIYAALAAAIAALTS